jgi:hypothetical protein
VAQLVIWLVIWLVIGAGGDAVRAGDAAAASPCADGSVDGPR